MVNADEEYTNLSENDKAASFGVSVSDDEVVFIGDEGDFFHLPLKSPCFECTLLGAMIQFKMITVNYNWHWVDTESPELVWQYEVDEVGGKHGEGLGVNPNGVSCGECCKNTCKGCEYELFEGGKHGKITNKGRKDF